mgnify:CR=1 FL=1
MPARAPNGLQEPTFFSCWKIYVGNDPLAVGPLGTRKCTVRPMGAVRVRGSACASLGRTTRARKTEVIAEWRHLSFFESVLVYFAQC